MWGVYIFKFRVMSNLDANRVRVSTVELMSGVSQLWTDLDLRSQHQSRTSGVRKGKQRIRRWKAATDTRGLAHFTSPLPSLAPAQAAWLWLPDLYPVQYNQTCL